MQTATKVESRKLLKDVLEEPSRDHIRDLINGDFVTFPDRVKEIFFDSPIYIYSCDNLGSKLNGKHGEPFMETKKD